MLMPRHIHALACSDFDETYFAHDRSNAEDVAALTQFLSTQTDLLFGIVSASTLDMITSCLDEMQMEYPHFISSNSGTELYYYKEGELIYDQSYEEVLLEQGFSKTTIIETVEQLEQEGIHLELQALFVNAPFSRNYYYYETEAEQDKLHLERIRNIATQHGLIVNISKCNPLIGDPANAYDVDFFPQRAGKDAIVRYLIQKYDIDFEQTYAFGDSGNDIKMLKAVKHGYLVSNATAEAKSLYPHHASHPYNKGILSILQKRTV
ncbi:HAD-IIB family hydrolase [Macrococcus hajekii]|uniref:HAD-IIB family hydrolase n=1 Tax=Macrococcus hajekii TaxID=198482 RepID=A0A4R6BJP9_9STAP|nr:HAD-IIB family hydrolase [Macrococcus hajekii]TDM01850.1 HAD-IIB family hydrolase [Macrococcus hajekii]GGB07972.1 kanosamine-6-phosphate phosphatase [Macrococcus hajekii]